MAINLLPKNLQSARVQRNYRVIANAVSIALLVLLVTGVMVLFSYRYTVTKEYDTLNQQVQELQDQIGQQKDNEWFLSSIHTKIAGASTILQSQPPQGYILEDIKIRADQLVEILDLAISEENHLILEGSGETLDSIAEYVDKLVNSEFGYLNIKVTALSFNQIDFNYTFQLEFDYQGDSNLEYMNRLISE